MQTYSLSSPRNPVSFTCYWEERKRRSEMCSRVIRYMLHRQILGGSNVRPPVSLMSRPHKWRKKAREREKRGRATCAKGKENVMLYLFFSSRLYVEYAPWRAELITEKEKEKKNIVTLSRRIKCVCKATWREREKQRKPGEKRPAKRRRRRREEEKEIRTEWRNVCSTRIRDGRELVS